MAATAIIPARGGSVRVPRKNVRPFLGRPMISYVLGTALRSGLFEQVVVSTDDEEIAGVARECGASVPFLRPAALAGNDTPTSAVVLHALDRLEEHGKIGEADYLCCVYPTAVLTTIDDLRRGLQILVDTGAATAYSVVEYPHPIWRAMRENPDGRIEMIWPEHANTRTQDLPRTFHDAGQFYWARVSTYRAERSFYTTNSVPVLLPRFRVQDIDTPEDWTRAELIYRVLHSVDRPAAEQTR